MDDEKPSLNIEENTTGRSLVTGEGNESEDHILLSNLLENPNGSIQKTSKIFSITGVPYTSPASLLMKRVDSPRAQLARKGSTSKLLIANIINESNVNDSLKTTSPCNFSNSSKCNSPSNHSVTSGHSRTFESENALQANQPSTPKHTPSHFSSSEPKTFEQKPTVPVITHHLNEPASVCINIADILKISSRDVETTPSKTVSESRNVIISSTFQSLDTPKGSDRIDSSTRKQQYSDDNLMAHNVTPSSTISSFIKQQPTPKTTTPKKVTSKSRSVGVSTPKSLFSKANGTLSTGGSVSKFEKASAKEWQSLVNISEQDITHNLSKMNLTNVSVHHYDDTDFTPNSYDLKSKNQINHVKQTIHQHKLLLAKRELDSKERKKLLSPYVSQEIDRVTKNIMEGADYDHKELFPSPNISRANKDRIKNVLSNINIMTQKTKTQQQ